MSSTAPAIVIRWNSPIYFAAAEKFISFVTDACTSAKSSNSSDYGSARLQTSEDKLAEFGADEEPVDSAIVANQNGEQPHQSQTLSNDNENTVTAVIVDVSGVTFIDTVGLDAIVQLATDLSGQGIDLVLVSCPPCVMDILHTNSSLMEFVHCNTFVTALDALVAVKRFDRFAQVLPKRK